MCASSPKKSYSLILIWDENDDCLLLCLLHPGLGRQQADTSGGQGEASQLRERQQVGKLGSGARPGSVTSAVTSTGFMGERGSSASRQIE